MKTTFKLGSIEFNGVKIENIELTQEYSVSEAINMISFGKQFVSEIIDEAPMLFEKLEKAFNKFDEVQERQEENSMEKHVTMLLDTLDKEVIREACSLGKITRINAVDYLDRLSHIRALIDIHNISSDNLNNQYIKICDRVHRYMQ